MLKPLPQDLKAALIRTEEMIIRDRVSGFSVPEIEIAEASYAKAKEIWEANGYFDPSSEFMRISDVKSKEQKLAASILPPVPVDKPLHEKLGMDMRDLYY
jgi:ATP sulfurylase